MLKSSVALLSLLLWPVAAMAQKPTSPAPAPQIVVEPDARALLSRATAKHKALNGLRFSVRARIGAEQGPLARVEFARPHSLRVKIEDDAKEQIFFDGTTRTRITGDRYEQEPFSEAAVFLLLGQSSVGLSTQFVAQMLQGQSPLDFLQKAIGRIPNNNLQLRVRALPLTVVNGEGLEGVQIRYSYQVPGHAGASRKLSSEQTLWFDSQSLVLRRTQARDISGRTPETLLTAYSNVELNPMFAPDAFEFDPTGLTPATAQEEAPSYDARLKVGAAPLPFSAKALNGQTISPANYKGKVLIMDFWATWCGPCVAALPDLQATYNKHHKQGLEIVGISLDEDKTALTSFVKARKIGWPQIFDGKGWEAAIVQTYGVQAIPFVLVVGKNGKIAAVDPDDLESAVKTALAKS